MLVIGNGESRLGLDIDTYKRIKIGCNAIHRDYYVHHLVCCDRRMVIEAQEKRNYGSIYTRSDWKDQFKLCGLVPPLPYEGDTRPDDPWHWGSGPYALLLGSYLSEKHMTDPTIHIIGFDIGSESDKVNNIYKSTPNYNDADTKPVDPSYWIYQMNKVFECFDKVQFIYYNNKPWPKIINNVTSKRTEEFNAIRS
tara:strand:+ start:5890 stop:6474 length:585 start_codon:yes stop_codon:yes gene_type:complete